MLKKCVSFALVLVLTLAFVSVTKSAEVGKITVNPASESVLKGELLKVDIRAKDLSEVYALSFEIKYESAILFFEDHEWGSFISKDVEPVKHFAKPSSGRLMITVSNVDGKTDLPTGPATICTIKFKGIMASGNSPIKIEKIEARKRNFEEIELEGENASVIVTSPPTKPELVVKPVELDFGTLKLGECKTLSVNAYNMGKEGLKGTTESQNFWIEAEPIKFESEDIDINITVCPGEGLMMNKTHKGRLSIYTNGGSKDVICIFYLQEKQIEQDFPPDLTIDSPKDGMITNQSNIVVKGRTNSDATLKINRMPREIATDGSFEYEMMLLEGENNIVISAKGKTGRITEKIVTVYLDSMVPVLKVDDPGEVVHTNPLVLKGFAEPGCTIKTGGKSVKVGESGEFTVSLPIVAGENKLELVATDAAGNTTSWTKTIQYVAQETVSVVMWIDEPKAYINGKMTFLQVPPVIKNGRTFVPVRFVSESLRAEVLWDGETRSVTVNGPKHTCIVVIDQDTAFIDGKLVKLDAAPFIQNSTTLVPLRFIAQDTLGGEIDWNGEERKITILVTYDISQ
ncbi:MAG TPA: stalk domain-containing protein [Caldisericia bacterium]|nr:stalk domain-containing protein [Caldisericia bacterium]HPI83761.1 stalk domain-containing protein [Caldisericia bacterium]HPQ93034.1 stalk domain-containing protein [Caldisericia bacterium]HRV75133.1 stalk domain-containing protein [Caldisericia bacterium]